MIKINRQLKNINLIKNKYPINISSGGGFSNNNIIYNNNNSIRNNNNKYLFNNNNNIINNKYYSTHLNENEIKKTSILDLKKKYKENKTISMVTAYDVTSSKEVDKAGIDMILVGDSLGMVMLGEKGTTSVTMDQMIHHCKAVMKGSKRAFVVGDMPFGSFESSPRDAVLNAIRIMKEGGVDAIKLEGGKKHKDQIRAIVNAGIPVVGHIGLTPQTASALGGFKLQGKTSEEALTILEDAKALEEAGCFAIVLEMVPDAIASSITQLITIPTIGIGAGNGTSGQVLVYHDMLGLYSDFVPKFCKQYTNLSETINKSLKQFKSEIESKEFPSPTHSFSMKDSELSTFLDQSTKDNNSTTLDKSKILENNKNIANQNKLLKQQQQQQPSTSPTPTPTVAASTNNTSQLINNNQQQHMVVPNKLSLNENGKKPKIVVIGAGAMGSFFSAKLASKGIADVWMVSSWKEHVDNINNNGLKFFNVQGKEENVRGIRATLDGMEVLKDGNQPDLALVLVKSNSTRKAAETAATLVSGNPNASVITLQNGIGNREEIESIINVDRGLKNHVWQGVTSNGAIVVSPGLVKQTGIGTTYLSSPYLIDKLVSSTSPSSLLPHQSLSSSSSSPLPTPTTLEEKLALEAFSNILNESGISSGITYDVDSLVWSKVVANAAINPLSAVLGVSNGELLENEYSKNLMKKIIIEAMSVCKAKGIKLPYGEDSEEGFKYVADIAYKTSANYSSMLQDVIRGQPTEVKSINGVIVKEGEKFDINVSHNKMIMEMVLSCTKNKHISINN